MDIAEVELAVKVKESPSQNSELVEVNAYASTAKLKTGSKLLIIDISSEKEEQPPPVAVFVFQDLTLTREPSFRVLVVNTLESDLDPTGLLSI